MARREEFQSNRDKPDFRPVVLVSGGTAGIGKEVVARLLQFGHRVATFSRSEQRVTELRRQYRDHPGLFVERFSLTDYQGLRALVGRIERQLGAITILVNNAGLVAPLGAIGGGEWREILETVNTNLTGTIVLTSLAVERMKEQGIRGVVVSVSSGSSRGVEGLSTYSATKAGINAFSAATARECRDYGIRVFAFNPGHVDTSMQVSIRESGDLPAFRFQKEMTELKKQGKLVTPSDSARHIVYLALHPEKFSTARMVDYRTVIRVSNGAANRFMPQFKDSDRRGRESLYECLRCSRGTCCR